MKITKEYLRKLIVEQLEEVHDVKFMGGGYTNYDQDTRRYAPGPLPRFTQTIFNIANVAADLRAEIGSVIEVYVKNERAKKDTLAKIKELSDQLESIYKYLSSAHSKSAGDSDTVNEE